MKHLDYFHFLVSKQDCFPWNMNSLSSGTEEFSASGNPLQLIQSINKYNFTILASPASSRKPVLKAQNTAVTVRMSPGRCPILYLPGVKHEYLGEILPPHNEFVLLDSGLASKDVKRDVITLGKYTKEEK